MRVEALDEHGNLAYDLQKASSAGDSIYLAASTADGILTYALDVVDGVADAIYNITTPQADVTLSLHYTTPSAVAVDDVLDFGENKSLLLQAGEITRVVFIPAPAQTVSTDGFDLELRALDKYGNTGRNSDTSVDVRVVQDLTADTSASLLSNGRTTLNPTGTVRVINTVAEVVTLALLADPSTPTINRSATTTIDFIPAAVASHVFHAAAGTPGSIQSISVDNPMALVVVAYDEFFNINATNTTIEIELTGSATASPSEQIAMVNGVAHVNVSNTVPEVVRVTLGGATIAGVNQSSTFVVVFGHGDAVRVAIVQPDEVLAGTSREVQVRVVDQFNNTATSYARGETRQIEVIGSGTNVFGTGVVTLVNGTSSKNFTSQVAQDVTLSLDWFGPVDGNVAVSDEKTLVVYPGNPCLNRCVRSVHRLPCTVVWR